MMIKPGVKTAEEVNDSAEEEMKDPGRLLGLQEATAELRCPVLTKEAVYEWFGLHLNPANRVELMYGLLHMCQPLELRFLGSCLEDIARKDVHVLRNFEMRANSAGDLGLLTDVSDPVTRSKLLVCLSLLASDNRECAGVLFRILSHVDPAGLVSPCPDSVCSPSVDSHGEATQDHLETTESRSRFLEQMAVLFTMASLHPAFLFHQRDKLRMQVENLEYALTEERSRHYKHHKSLSQRKPQKPECFVASTGACVNEKSQSHKQGHAHHSRSAGRNAVYIEKIVLKNISWSKKDREYSFEVKWSDFSTSSVTKTHLELENLLLKLPKEHSTDLFKMDLLLLLNQGQKVERREVEQTLKEKFLSAPHAFHQTEKVCVFFHCGSKSSLSHSCNRYTGDCSEASSQEEDMEPYVQGHHKKPGNKSPSLNVWSTEDKRMANDSEKNSFTNRRNKSCALKPTCSQNTKPIDEDGENSLTKPNARASTNSEKGVGRISYVTNGIISLPSKLVHHSKGKGNGPCQNPHGETSSESYSSPSSPQFDGRESLENGDDKGKDTDSHSDDPRKSVAHTVLVCPVTGGATNDLHTLVPPENQEIHPQDSLQGTVVEFPHFAHHTPCTNFNGPEVLASVSSLQVSDSKADTELMMPHPLVIPTSSATIDGSEKCSSEAPSAFQSFSASVCSLKSPSSSVLQPILQRFKTAGAQPGTKNSVLVPPAHQSSLSATGVLQSGPAYPPALQTAYSNTDPVLSSVTLAESHTKSTGLTLSSVLPPSFSLPVPTTGMSPTGIVGIASSSQVSALVVPTHMPGPTPSPIPALTHSTAQSDGSSYINSSASNSIPQLQQQQLPAAQQLLGCNACRCRGSCGNNHANYYFPTQMPPQQVFNVPPVFQLSSLSSSSYLTQISHTQQSNGDTQMPFYPSAPSAFAGGTLVHPRCHSRSDHVTGSQAASFGLQQMTAFTRFYQPIYTAMVPGASSRPAMGLGTVSGGINKKNGSIYCCNCGGSGHYAQDCKQLPFDATQQGGFRLKYAPNSEALDGNPD